MENLNKEEIIKIILNHLTKEQKDQSIIYLNYEPYKSGDIINIGRKSIEVKKTSYLAFVDLQPRLNWGHSCIYFLIDSKTLETELFHEQFPVFYEDYPESYRVLLRYGSKPSNDRHFNVYD